MPHLPSTLIFNIKDFQFIRLVLDLIIWRPTYHKKLAQLADGIWLMADGEWLIAYGG